MKGIIAPLLAFFLSVKDDYDNEESYLFEQDAQENDLTERLKVEEWDQLNGDPLFFFFLWHLHLFFSL